MRRKLENNASVLFAGALTLFLIGGSLTTVLPAMTEKSWRQPTGQGAPHDGPQALGRAVYVREGCWYCHTQQVRTLLADTKRFGWRGVDAPISLPGEYTRDTPHLLGTRRIGPDLARVGGKYSKSWHRTHFINPRDLVPGSVMPPFPWLTTAGGGQDFDNLVAYLQTLGRARAWRPDNDYED